MNLNQDKEYWQTIWENFKNGDRRSFEIIYNEFVDALFAYGSKITKDRNLLEDAVHDLFIDVYTYGKSLRQPEYLEFYLYKTLRNILIRKFRENNRFNKNVNTPEQFDLTFPVEETNEEALQTEKRFQLLQREIKNLDAKKRELLFLKFNSGLTYSEIGKLLEMKPDTVKKQVHRLLSYFRDKLGATFFELLVICFKA